MVSFSFILKNKLFNLEFIPLLSDRFDLEIGNFCRWFWNFRINTTQKNGKNITNV